MCIINDLILLLLLSKKRSRECEGERQRAGIASEIKKEKGNNSAGQSD